MSCGALFDDIGGDGVPSKSVTVILPSQYTRADIATPSVTDVLKEQNGKEYSPLVIDRNRFFHDSLSISVDNELNVDGCVAVASIGRTVGIEILMLY